MSDVQRLKSEFEAEAITPFDPDIPADEWEATSMVGRASPPTQWTDLRQMLGGELGPFISQMEFYLRRFRFGEINNQLWDRRYKFPKNRANRVFFLRNGKQLEMQKVINRSQIVLDRWIRETLIQNLKREEPEIIVVVGDVGSGKSSLNKYITSRYMDEFSSVPAFTTRIEYRKLYNWILRRVDLKKKDARGVIVGLGSAIETFVICCMIRDVFHYMWSNASKDNNVFSGTFEPRTEGRWPALDIDNAASGVAFLEFLADRGVATDAAKAFRNLVRHANAEFRSTNMRKRAFWFQDLISNEERRSGLEWYLFYAVRHIEIKPFVIFDGLDYIQVSDFIGRTTHRTIMQSISELLARHNGRIGLPSISDGVHPTFQVTMRPNTYELFWQAHSQALGMEEPSVYYVISPNFWDVFSPIAYANTLAEEGDSGESIRAELQEIYRRLERALASEVNIKQSRLGDLFANNVRYRMHYVRNVLEEILRETRATLDKSREPVSREYFVKLLRSQAIELATERKYRLVDILLHSKHDRFANFVRIEDVKINLKRHQEDVDYLETTVKDNNLRSGYISNIFNYHIPYDKAEDVRFFLEKIRVLDALINNDDGPSTEIRIKNEFLKRGWPISEYFDFTLGIMLRENFIAGVGVDSGSSGYVVTEIGRIVRASLMTNMSYLENVYFGCFLPRFVKRQSADIYRGNFTHQTRYRWVAASIYHCWLLLRLIRTAEGWNRGGVFEEVRNVVAKTIDRIVDSPNTDSRTVPVALRYIETFRRNMKE
jgi:hypothetical protein